MTIRLGGILVFAALFGAGGLEGADTVIEVLSVRNRPASDLVSPVQALLGSEARVTSHDSKLIVNAPRHLMSQAKRLVAQLDVQPQSLWITVRQGHDLDAGARSAGAAVAAGPDGVAVGGHPKAVGVVQDVELPPGDVRHVAPACPFGKLPIGEEALNLYTASREDTRRR